MKENKDSHQLILFNRYHGEDPFEIEVPRKNVSDRDHQIKFGSYKYILGQFPANQKRKEAFVYTGSNCQHGDITTRLRSHLHGKFSMSNRLSVLALMKFERGDVDNYEIDRWESIFHFAMKMIASEVSKKTKTPIRIFQHNRPNKKTSVQLEERYGVESEKGLEDMDLLDFKLQSACASLRPLMERFCKNKTML